MLRGLFLDEKRRIPQRTLLYALVPLVDNFYDVAVLKSYLPRQDY